MCNNISVVQGQGEIWMEIHLVGDFVKFLIVKLQKNGVKLPFRNPELWHSLFYKLRAMDSLEKPSFFDKLRFDWDGPYPKSPELSEFLHGLCMIGAVICDSPQYENYRLPEGLFTLWEQKLEKLDEVTKQFVGTAANIASEEFAQTRPV